MKAKEIKNAEGSPADELHVLSFQDQRTLRTLRNFSAQGKDPAPEHRELFEEHFKEMSAE